MTQGADINGGLRLLDGAVLGIFGAGHFGRALAVGLLEAGFPHSELRICHRGSEDTRRELQEMGLDVCLCDRRALTREADIVLYVVRPQDWQAIADCKLRPGSLLVSLLAGIPRAHLPVSLPLSQRIRVTASSPLTLQAKNGIAAMYPVHSTRVRAILHALGLRVFALDSEKDMDPFTAFCTCLPTALTYCQIIEHPVNEEELLEKAARHRLPDYASVLAWAHEVQPRHPSIAQLQEYVAKAATPGGVTEAVLQALRAGKTLATALECGVRRCRQLSQEAIEKEGISRV